MKHLEYFTRESRIDRQYEMTVTTMRHLHIMLRADGKLSVLGFGLLTDIVVKLELLGHEIEESYK